MNGISVAANPAADKQRPRRKLKHGLNSYCPLTCRGAGCPYRVTCSIPDNALAMGEPCVVESGIYDYLIEGYIQEFQADESNCTDMVRIRRLVDVQIKLMRCNRLTAVNPEMVITTWAYAPGVGEYIVKHLNPVVSHELRLLDEHIRLLADLRAYYAG